MMVWTDGYWLLLPTKDGGRVVFVRPWGTHFSPLPRPIERGPAVLHRCAVRFPDASGTPESMEFSRAAALSLEHVDRHRDCCALCASE